VGSSLGALLLGGGLVLVGTAVGPAPAQAAPTACSLPSSAVHTFDADSASTYVVPDGIHAIVATVAGGSGSINSDYTTPIAPGALVRTVLAVTPGDNLGVDVLPPAPPARAEGRPAGRPAAGTARPTARAATTRPARAAERRSSRAVATCWSRPAAEVAARTPVWADRPDRRAPPTGGR
jgi:hypothetical protein